MPVIPAPRRLSQDVCFKSEASRVYIVSSRPAWTGEQNLISTSKQMIITAKRQNNYKKRKLKNSLSISLKFLIPL